MKRNPFTLLGFWVIAMIWLEVVFHILQFHSIGISILWPMVLIVPMASFFTILCRLTKSSRWNFILSAVLLFFCSAVYGANLVYYGIFRTFLAMFNQIAQGNAANALGFWPFLALGIKTIFKKLPGIIILLIPFFWFLLYGKKYISFRRTTLVNAGCMAGITAVTWLITVGLVHIGSRDAYSVYDLYYNNSSLSVEVEKLGIATAMRLDLCSVLWGGEESGLDVDVEAGEDWQANLGGQDKDKDPDQDPDSGEPNEETEAETETETEPEPVDIHDIYEFYEIDFDDLIEKCKDDTVLSMHKFFAAQTPTMKNDYTGIYEGYNLIFITAEGFSPYAVDKDITPTLYKLVNTGYVFNNYYTPLWYGSTSGGEYVNVMSQYPKDGGYVSMQESGSRKSDMYLSLGRTMERAGYNMWGFHNNSNTYYGRNLSMPNMGYEQWIATGTGYDPELSKSGKPIWPQSDERLIEQSFEMYKDAEPFHAYYMTVSGHVEYNFVGNSMAMRNKEAVQDLPLSDTAKAYLACHIELDHAMESLINKLQETGLADHTLVVLTADHIPYNNEEMCSEIAAWQKEKAGEAVSSNFKLESNFELYRNNLIIWTGSLEGGSNIVVDKPCHSLDVLPTVLNMLGIDYESRVLMGKDIFADNEGLVVFPNRSWITETASYNAKNGEVKPAAGKEASDEYVSDMKKLVSNKLKVSRSIIDVDYYSYLH